MRLARKWALVCLYTVGIFVITPYLPQLIRTATSRWSKSSVSHFVLILEIAIGLLILSLALVFLIQKKKKSVLFLISMGGIFLLSFILYKFIPNPYEFTHLPEYAFLSILIMRAVDNRKGKHLGIKKEKNIQSAIIRNSYFLSGLITGVVGTGDEIYQHILPNRFFGWHDILLNVLGGILGLLIFWGIKR